MDRAEFMRQLKELLLDIPENEREEALEYYNSYFDDAGPENEARVIGELGSPGKVAAIIKADLREGNEAYGEYTERGYEDSRMKEKAQVPGRYGRWMRRRRDNKSTIILIVILLVFASPILLGIGGGLLGVIFGIFSAVIGLVAGLFGLIIGAAFGGIGLFIDGIFTCFTSPAVGLLEIGLGFLGMAAGLVFLVFGVWLVSKAVPWLLRKISGFVHKAGGRFQRKQEGEAKE